MYGRRVEWFVLEDGEGVVVILLPDLRFSRGTFSWLSICPKSSWLHCLLVLSELCTSFC